MSGRLKVDPIGGQAVIEGVMMRGPHGIGLALRTPEGEIHLKQEPMVSWRERYPLLKWPLVRGMAALVESLSIGIKMLNYSAAIASGEDPAAESKESGWGLLLGVLLFVALFKFIPAFIYARLDEHMVPLLRSAIEGTVRIGLFVGYLALISLLKDVRRLFEYHGAEHQVINCVESGQELTPDTALACSPIHPRCGTSFLLITLLIQILVFSFIGLPGLNHGPELGAIAARVGLQLLLLPFVAGLSFELIRLAGQVSLRGAEAGLGARIALWVTLPGQWLQRLTTRRASRDQIEVAIASLRAAQEIPAPQLVP